MPRGVASCRLMSPATAGVFSYTLSWSLGMGVADEASCLVEVGAGGSPNLAHQC